MLIITRRKGQSVIVDGVIKVKLIKISSKTITILVGDEGMHNLAVGDNLDICEGASMTVLQRGTQYPIRLGFHSESGITVNREEVEDRINSKRAA